MVVYPITVMGATWLTLGVAHTVGLYLPDFSYYVATLVLTIATVNAAATATAKDRMWGRIYCNN